MSKNQWKNPRQILTAEDLEGIKGCLYNYARDVAAVQRVIPRKKKMNKKNITITARIKSLEKQVNSRVKSLEKQISKLDKKLSNILSILSEFSADVGNLVD